MIGLHLEPKSPDGLEDLRGRAAFADVWLGRLPRIALATGRSSNLFGENEEIELTATASGLPKGPSTVILQLTDVLGRAWPKSNAPSNPSRRPPAASCGNPLARPGILSGPGEHQGFAGRDRPRLALAVVKPLGNSAGSPFGWTLPHGESPLSPEQLDPLLREAGIGWVKLPMWYAPAESEKTLDRVLPWVERLGPPAFASPAYWPTRPRNSASGWRRRRRPPPPTCSAPPRELAAATRAHPRPAVRPDPLVAAWRRSRLELCRLSRPAGHARQGRTAFARLGGDVSVGIPWNWLD